MTKSQLPTAIRKVATVWATKITKKAKSLAPKHIAPHISSRVEVKGEASFIIRTTVDRSADTGEDYRNGTADARAQEYGSGDHATGASGKKGKIIIKPKLKNALWFPYNPAKIYPNVKTYNKDGVIGIVAHEVKSPGIPPIQKSSLGPGYIRPAIKEIRTKAKEELSPEVRKAILGDLRRSFGRKPK